MSEPHIRIEWALLFRYLAPHRRRLALYFGVLLVVTALEGVGLSMLIPILQAMGSSGNGDNIFVRMLMTAFALVGLPYTFRTIIGVFTAIVLTKYLIAAYERHLTRVLSAGVAYDLRRRSFENLMDLPLSYYYRIRLGDIVATQFTSSQNAGALVEYGAMMASATVFCLLYLCINALISLPLTLTAVVFLSVSYLFILPRFRRGFVQGTEEKALIDRINTFLYDTLAGIKVVKAFNAEDENVRQYVGLIARFRRLVVEMVHNKVVASLFMEPLVFVLVVGSLILSVELIHLSLVSLIAFLFIFAQLLPQVKVIHGTQLQIVELLPHLAKIDALITRHDKDYIPDGVRPIRKVEQEIVFDRVSFTYPGARGPALSDLSVALNAGTTTALVGGSGGGKTTLVDLVLRLHDPGEGTIRVDGHDLQEFIVADWRRLIGVVDQDPYLFNDTIENNIRFGCRDADTEAIRRAARLAYADEFISKLPDGYRTGIGTRGMNLSGGQRQRIALARALIRDPEILILDEATSALDSESERFIQQSIQVLQGRKTIIIVAHRLATIRHADRVLVIDGGRIVEQGTHAELMLQAGRYREYLTLQYQVAD